MRYRKNTVILAVAMLCGVARAQTYFTAHVTAVGTYGDGSLFIFLSTTISEPGCSAGSSRIDIAGTHPQVKTFYTTALAAFASGATVIGTVNGCDPASGSPTFDTTKVSYLYLQP